MTVPKGAKYFGWGMAIIGGMALIFFLAGFTGFFVMLLWNWLVPSIFGFNRPLTFWEAWGLSWLCSLLFKGSTTNNYKKETP